MARPKHRFISEIHLGLLIIIFALLFLNFVSNYILYTARTAKRESLHQALSSAAISISRNIKDSRLYHLDDSTAVEFRRQYRLSGIVLVPWRPPSDDDDQKRAWFTNIAGQFPAGQIPELAEKLIPSRFKTLTRGREEEYFYVYPAPIDAEKRLLILSARAPDLAFLDDGSRQILILSVVAMVLIGIVYLSLYRSILSPFRKIQQEAQEAGRLVGVREDDVDSMIVEYQQLIRDLRDKEAQLLALNQSIQQRADTLEQFNNHLLHSMSTGLIVVDPQQQVVSVNRAAAALFRLDVTTIVGKPIERLDSLCETACEQIRNALNTSLPQPYEEHPTTLPTGEKLHLGILISPIMANDSACLGASILIQDLTEIKRLQAELEAKNQMVALGEMSGGLAHQLRNSLGAILGYTRLLKKRLEKSGDNTSAVSSLEEETRQAEMMIGRFLNFARPMDYHPEPCVIGELLAEAIDAVRVRFEHKRVRFDLQSENGQNTINADPLLLKQALTNLLENAAIAYDESRGTVAVTIETADSGISITIRDQGCGIAPEDLNRVFTPFYSSRPLGTGLGLPLAKKIIDLHRGRLIIESSLGRGTTCTIELPVSVSAPNTVFG